MHELIIRLVVIYGRKKLICYVTNLVLRFRCWVLFGDRGGFLSLWGRGTMGWLRVLEQKGQW